MRVREKYVVKQKWEIRFSMGIVLFVHHQDVSFSPFVGTVKRRKVRYLLRVLCSLDVLYIVTNQLRCSAFHEVPGVID